MKGVVETSTIVMPVRLLSGVHKRARRPRTQDRPRPCQSVQQQICRYCSWASDALLFVCINPGPRGLAMIQNSRSLSKRSGGNTSNGRETNRHITGSHQAATSSRPSVHAGVTRVLPACTGQAGRS